MIHNIKLFFSVASWGLALPVVLLANQLAIPVLRVLQDAALISFSSLLMVAMLGLRAQTLIVTIILFMLSTQAIDKNFDNIYLLKCAN